jgi:rhodanese-related sulfurtransferase
MNARGLAGCVDGEAYILDGGIEAWKAAGFPVKRG